MNAIEYINSVPSFNVVKKTISYVGDSITSEIRMSVRAFAYSASVGDRRGDELLCICEGESFRVYMMENNEDNAARALELVSEQLSKGTKPYEVILMLNYNSSKFGLALVEYYSPENW